MKSAQREKLLPEFFLQGWAHYEGLWMDLNVTTAKLTTPILLALQSSILMSVWGISCCQPKWQSAQWGGIRLPLKWEPNKPARLSLSVFAPLSSSPSSPLSAVTPPLSPSVASPPPRRLSLKRFSLFSRFPGKHLHGPKEGGREGFLLKTTSPFSVFYNCHLQSPDPASRGPNRV